VIFLEPKRLYNGPFDGHHDTPVVPWSKHALGNVPTGYYRVPLESATVFRPGSQVTVLTYGTMVWVAECAARESGVDAEIIDLRSIWPMDLDTVVASVKKTGRCVIVHEAARTGGFGAEIAALIAERRLTSLLAPVVRVTGYDTIIPMARLEQYYMPSVERIMTAARKVCQFG
jgi:2-oxoisovalerate dehydrogenase E1 component beta subunit